MQPQIMTVREAKGNIAGLAFATQHDFSSHALLMKRQIEAIRGEDHLHNGPSGTPRRGHTITDRAARKAKARALVLAAGIGGGETPLHHRHSAQRHGDVPVLAMGNHDPVLSAAINPALAAGYEAHRAVSLNPGDDIYVSAARQLGKTDAVVATIATVPRYFVGGEGEEWYIYDGDNQGSPEFRAAGPYKAKKTANRACRTLNGE